MRCTISQKLTFDDIYHNVWKVDLSCLAVQHARHARREAQHARHARREELSIIKHSADRKAQTDEHDEHQSNENKVIEMLASSCILRIETDIYDEAKCLERLASANYQFAYVNIKFCHWTTYQTISNVLEFISRCKKIDTCLVKLLGVDPLDVEYDNTSNRQQFAYVMDFVTLLTQMKNIKRVKLSLTIKKDYDLSKFIDVDIKSQTSNADSLYGFIHKTVEF